MSSGVSVNEACLSEYQSLKLKKKLKFIIFGLNSTNTEIVVVKTSESQEFEDFVSELPETECRWAVYDLEFDVEGAKRNKLVFVSWSPDTAKIKNKMVFASSKDALRRSLDGIGAEIQGTAYDEVSQESFLEKVSRR